MKKTPSRASREKRNQKIISLYLKNVGNYDTKTTLYAYIAARVGCCSKIVQQIIKSIDNN